LLESSPFTRLRRWRGHADSGCSPGAGRSENDLSGYSRNEE
jgi:hypothetical protein